MVAPLLAIQEKTESGSLVQFVTVNVRGVPVYHVAEELAVNEGVCPIGIRNFLEYVLEVDPVVMVTDNVGSISRGDNISDE